RPGPRREARERRVPHRETGMRADGNHPQRNVTALRSRGQSVPSRRCEGIDGGGARAAHRRSEHLADPASVKSHDPEAKMIPAAERRAATDSDTFASANEPRGPFLEAR